MGGKRSVRPIGKKKKKKRTKNVFVDIEEMLVDGRYVVAVVSTSCGCVI